MEDDVSIQYFLLFRFSGNGERDTIKSMLMDSCAKSSIEQPSCFLFIFSWFHVEDPQMKITSFVNE